MKKKYFVTIACLLISTPLLFGHGVKVKIEKKSPFIIATARYHGGKALNNADVTVRFQTNKNEFQTGKTDKNGNFCFYPDQPGKWTTSVDDGMGHRGKKEITIDNTFFNPPTTPVTAKEPPQKELKEIKETQQPKPAKENKENKENKEKKEKKKEKIPLTQNDMCCYLLKIVLGVVLILVITLILHNWKKKMESGTEKKK